MQTKFYLLIIGAIAIGFLGGFFLANSLNRAEIKELNEKLVAAAPTPGKKSETGGKDLSKDEIEKSLADAKARPDDFNFQKRLGLALYGYAASKNDEGRLDDVEVLLGRAYKLKSDDFEVLVSLANLNYDIGRLRDDQKRILESKKLYQKAIEMQPGNVRVLADYAVTHLDSSPPDVGKSIELLEKAHAIDKKNESVLFYMIKAYIAGGKLEKARTSLADLKTLNPNNSAVKEFEAKMKEETAK